MRAYLKNHRQSPRKTRVVADLVRGKRVDQALVFLSHTPKRASEHLSKLIKGALANARQANAHITPDNLVIKEIRVDKGITLKRVQPAARGSAHTIRKRASNVTLVLEHARNDKAQMTNSEKILKKK